MSLTFTINPLVFQTKTLKSIIKVASGYDGSLFMYMGVIILIHAPISWIRTVESFRIGFIYSMIVILFNLVCVATFEVFIIRANDN